MKDKAMTDKSTKDKAMQRKAMQRKAMLGKLLKGNGQTHLLLADERGDVPGWVLITLMTAGLVVLMWSLAGPAFTTIFDQAVGRVLGF